MANSHAKGKRLPQGSANEDPRIGDKNRWRVHANSLGKAEPIIMIVNLRQSTLTQVK